MAEEGKRLADDGLLVEEDFELLPRETDVAPEDAIGPGDDLAEQKVMRFGGVPQEEIGMNTQPVVVGPPAYGSPDPDTSAGRLVPIQDHPLDPVDKISDDYGADVEGATSEFVSEGSHHGGPSGTDLEQAQRGEGDSGDYSEMKVDELKDLARERGIEGASAMNKKELVAAHKAFDGNGDDEDEDNS